MICEYGCGQEANYQLKNGKWCCSKTPKSCIKIIEKRRISNMGKHNIKRPDMKGNNNPAKRTVIREKLKEKANSIKTREKCRNTCKERYNTDYVSQIEEVKEKKKNTCRRHFGTDYPSQSDCFKNKVKETCLLKYGVDNVNKIEEARERARKQMIENLGYVHSFIKSPSKEELKLREILSDLSRELNFIFEHTYRILNYEADITIPEYKIAIEYDGWYHFNCQESKDYHDKRQKEIEALGWKFIRYNIFQKFPTKEQVKNDIMKVRNESGTN